MNDASPPKPPTADCATDNAPSESNEEALLRNFLLVDHPNKGQLFKDFIEQIEGDEKKDS